MPFNLEILSPQLLVKHTLKNNKNINKKRGSKPALSHTCYTCSCTIL